MHPENSSYYLVVGLGKSGVSMAKFLRSRGENVVATDMDASKSDIAMELNQIGVKTEIGFHNHKTFNQAGIIVPSPGVPLTSSFIRTAVRHGVAITGELDIFSQYNRLPVIAITGTNGKTTTTTLIGNMLIACGMTPFVCGNIGTPLVDHLTTASNADVIVAEISSFQLDLSHRFKPDVAVLLNVSQDHLDRYEDYTAYEDAKWSLFKHQDADDSAVINLSVTGAEKVFQTLKSKILTFSSRPDTRDNASAKIHSDHINIHYQGMHHTLETHRLTELNGAHNRENIAAAALACLAIGADINQASNGLAAFKNLPHRMQFIASIQGVSFYNDSKATNADAVIRALESLEKNIILILGGREKNTDFSLMASSVARHVKTIVAIGESKAHIKEAFETICPVQPALTMKQAVETAFAAAQKDDIVLLSPACASFDMYDNYPARGNDFITHVTALEPR